MSDIRIRAASGADLPRLTEIYNHYVVHTPVTFDVEPYSIERRAAWFDQFSGVDVIVCWSPTRAAWL